MSRTLQLLTALLGLQLLVILGMYLPGTMSQPSPGDGALLSFKPDAVDRILISDDAGATLTLERMADSASGAHSWRVLGATPFPADAEKVGAFLEQLAGLEGGHPVTTSPSAQVRFRVADETFERRIELESAERSLGTLYVGTSPGVRETHLRPGDAAAVYRGPLALHDAPLTEGAWHDRTLLQIDPSAIVALQFAGAVEVRRASDDEPEGNWIARKDDQPYDGTLDGAALDELLEALATLRIGDVLGTREEAGYSLEQPVTALTLTLADGTTINYRLGKREAEADYVLKSSQREEFFRLPAYSGERFEEAARIEALFPLDPASDEAPLSPQL